MTTNAISVENLSKRFRIGVKDKTNDTLGGTIADFIGRPVRNLRKLRKLSKFEGGVAPSEDIIWALKDVSFDVEPGESVGIIGANGAGKSTLLKILTRITEPTSGRAIIKGRVSSLLEVGTGFHQELTGRENVYLNGSVLGMTRQEIDRKFDEIVDFSGVEQFIDTPVKRYSSGMKVRLAFSVAAHLEPEILIVDEVLAVGDVAFQRKCLGKMDDFAGAGRTVLLVSHKMEAIMGLCSRAIWLKSGEMVADGPATEIVKDYLTVSSEQGESQISLAERENRIGDGPLRFTGFHIRDEYGRQVESVIPGGTVDFVFTYSSDGGRVPYVSVWFWILDGFGQKLMCLWSRLTGEDFDSLPSEGELVCRIDSFPLVPGKYTVDMVQATVNGIKADGVPDVARFEVANGDYYGTGRPLERVGQFLTKHSWSFSESSVSKPKREEQRPVAVKSQ